MSRALLRHGVPPKASGHSCVRDRFGQSPGTRSQHVLSATCSCVLFPFQRMKGRIPSEPRRPSGSPQRRCRALSVSTFCGAVISEPHGLIPLGSSHSRGALPSSLTGWLRFLPSWERLSFPVFTDGTKHVSSRLGRLSIRARCFHGRFSRPSPALWAGRFHGRCVSEMRPAMALLYHATCRNGNLPIRPGPLSLGETGSTAPLPALYSQ